MFFRRKGIASTILAIALLIALLASVNSLVNNINSQTNALSKLASVGKTYLVVSQNSTSLVDSKVDSNVVDMIRNVSGVENVVSQEFLQISVMSPSGNYTVSLRGVDDVQAFFKVRHASVNGSYCANESQANIGSILSNLAVIKVNDSVNLSLDNKFAQVHIVGLVQSATQSDTEIVVPLKTVYALTGKNETISFIEFSLKDPNAGNEVISRVVQLLPANAKVVKTQQIATFVQDINNQIVSFLNLWSLAIYAIVVAASYVVATRLITEAKFELSMFRNLGAKRRFTVELVFVHTIAVAFLGSVLGLALGIAGAQVASTVVRWMWGNLQLSPFLDGGQALQIMLLALGSATIGCVYPAVKSTRNTSVENSL